jgi:hypothetical protein
MKQSRRDGNDLQGALRTFYQRILVGDSAVGQDSIISGRLKDGLSMTFELTWRSRSRSSSGGAQMKALACPTYPSILVNSSRMICSAQMQGDRPLSCCILI